ncbi:MAG: ATP-dependent DNA ligase, partial [Chitinophagales bacterium]|nr:ATP-dependent DNA ligase [Chitinophagales bacterium]
FEKFADLVLKVSSTTKTLEKEEALCEYFQHADDEEKIFALALLVGKKIKKPFTSTHMKSWCMEVAQIPEWLFEECYLNVGDLSETIALLLPDQPATQAGTLKEQINFLKSLTELEDEKKKSELTNKWNSLSVQERFVFNKLISGNFRIGVSKQAVVNALARLYSISAASVAHRLSGEWQPENISFDELLFGQHLQADLSKPYPFYLAYPLETSLSELGDPQEWLAEWKWDGIRGQVICRAGELFVWSRGEELITEKFPEFELFKTILPDGTVIDGEIVCYRDGKIFPFHTLQTRIGRKNISKQILNGAPAAFIAYDLLEWQGLDIRHRPMSERRSMLESLFDNFYCAGIFTVNKNCPVFILSPLITFREWNELRTIRAQSRLFQSEGIMLKRLNSPYQVGRKRGDWWKWKIEPLSVDAVLVAAQKGHGRRANLYTDYTFALRDGDELVTFAKAYSGLTDKEFAEVDAFIRKNIVEKFGPVRSVKPELVFEIGFEGIAESKRHKCGFAVRFPRMLRWRKDKTVNDIDTIDNLRTIFNLYGGNNAFQESAGKISVS